MKERIFYTRISRYGLQPSGSPPRQSPVRAVHTSRYNEILKRLRAARLAAGLSQVQVAKSLGKTQAFVSKCELGERRIDPLDVQDFATLYRKPLSHFVPT